MEDFELSECTNNRWTSYVRTTKVLRCLTNYNDFRKHLSIKVVMLTYSRERTKAVELFPRTDSTH